MQRTRDKSGGGSVDSELGTPAGGDHDPRRDEAILAAL